MDNTSDPRHRFEVVRKLGMGAMGEVQLAHDRQTGSLVALKFMVDCDNLAKAEMRLRRECLALKRLGHPGIVKYIGTLRMNDRFVLIQEHVDGITIRQWLNRLLEVRDGRYDFSLLLDDMSTGEAADYIAWVDEESDAEEAAEGEETPPPLSPDTSKYVESEGHIRLCAELARQAACALGHAHEKGVCHRDIKPENLMIDRDGRLRIIDFGVARAEGEVSMSQTRAVIGTPVYMSPEHLTGRVNVDKRSDVFSLGIVLYEALTLGSPYTARTCQAILKQVVTRPMPPLRWKNPGVPKALEAVVHRAIDKDPERRYPDGGAFAQDLARFLAGEPVSAPAYRYKPDLRDIAAGRPVRVTLSAMLLFVLASVYFLMILAHFTALPDVWKAGVVERWRPVVIFFLVGSLALAIGRGLFRAQTYAVRAAPVFSAVVGLGLLYIFLDAWWTQGRETTFAKIVFSGLVASNAFIVLAVLSQATRRWHREAIDIRADQLPRPASSRWSRLLTGLGRGRVPASPPPARDASPGVSPG